MSDDDRTRKFTTIARYGDYGLLLSCDDCGAEFEIIEPVPFVLRCPCCPARQEFYLDGERPAL